MDIISDPGMIDKGGIWGLKCRDHMGISAVEKAPVARENNDLVGYGKNVGQYEDPHMTPYFVTIDNALYDG